MIIRLVKLLKDKNPEAALEDYLKILENRQHMASAHSNLAIAFDMLQKKDESGPVFSAVFRAC